MKYLIVLDPLDGLNKDHDTSVGLMAAIRDRDNELWACQASDLFIQNTNAYAKAYANASQLELNLSATPWYSSLSHRTVALADFDIILMRKDPPFNMDYIFSTFMLDIAADNGVLVANNPRSLRQFNEKLLLNYFPELTTDYIVTSQIDLLNKFINKYRDTVIKPLDSMGGDSIYRLHDGDNNNKILQDLTMQQQRHVMLMPYIPEVVIGDKRILLINGKPCSHSLLRKPPPGQLQANLAIGGTGTVIPMSEHDYHICNKIAPFCMQHGLYLVGIDVIGNYVTEINITSPTCLREIVDYTNNDIALEFILGLEKIRSEST